MEQKRRFAEVFYNPITYLGVLVTILMLTVEVFLFAIDFFSHEGSLYLGLITYLVVPGFLFAGIALIILGVAWKRRRIRKGLPEIELERFRIDLAIPTHRNALLVFIVATAILVLMSLIGSYQAYHYTESVAFCGTLCHKVMHPEYTAYTNSPHGKVKCVECHIGPGADWFVKAKLSGLRQVYRTILNSYDRPIATPILNLRPAQETCLQCHWPGKFFSTLDLRRTYFLGEQDNLKWQLRMNLNVGGGQGADSGVHAHMNIVNDIYYAAEDEKRQKITWVRSIDARGKEHIFMTKDSKFREAPPRFEEIRKMDCIDCHTRPSHQYRPPDRLVNDAMERGQIDPGISGIKDCGVELLSKEYESTEAALDAIEKGVAKCAETATAMQRSAASEALKAAFQSNIFPAMKARWDVYPDNIGHMITKGCFRCHDNKHKADDGRTITNDCNSCHRIIEQGPAGQTEKNLDGLEFRHPNGEDDWKTTQCSKCHTGGAA